MPLASLNDLRAGMRIPGQAFGCFSVYTVEYLEGVMEAAEQEQAGVALSIDGVEENVSGDSSLVSGALSMARASRLPVAVHFNHARRIDLVAKALDAGFSSIMLDGSDLPIEENIELTRTAAQLAHGAGATIEGELGTFDALRARSGHSVLALAERFCRATGIDFMAVSVPKSMRDGAGPLLDFLANLTGRTQAGLVLHGASALGNEDLVRAVASGACKINFHTELKLAYREGMQKRQAVDPDDARGALQEAKLHVRRLVGEKIRLLLSLKKPS
jgi:fructose-bisphosphate aldolase, class II